MELCFCQQLPPASSQQKGENICIKSDERALAQIPLGLGCAAGASRDARGAGHPLLTPWQLLGSSCGLSLLPRGDNLVSASGTRSPASIYYLTGRKWGVDHRFWNGRTLRHAAKVAGSWRWAGSSLQESPFAGGEMKGSLTITFFSLTIQHSRI